MSDGKVADIVNSQTKTLLDQIEVFRILLKEMSVKLSQYESIIMELQHYAAEGFYGDLESPVYACPKCGRNPGFDHMVFCGPCLVEMQDAYPKLQIDNVRKTIVV